MNEKEFLEWCKQEVCDYTNKHLDKTDKKEITTDDVFIVWCCKTLQNNKALLSTTLFDGMYYECTYNGDKKKCMQMLIRSGKIIKLKKIIKSQETKAFYYAQNLLKA